MPLVSISEAARLAGKSRSTLYKTYIETGKLSVVQDSATGKPVVDTSELIRVFGQLRTTVNTVASTDTIIQDRTPEKDSEIKLLRELIKAKDEQIEAAKERESWMRRQLEEMTQTVKLIGHQKQEPVQEEVHNQQPVKETKTRWWNMKVF